MVRTAMAIEKDIDDAKSIQDAGASGKRKKSQPSSSTRKKQRTSTPQQFQGKAVAIKAKARAGLLAR